jgi:hypothetical protein
MLPVMIPVMTDVIYQYDDIIIGSNIKDREYKILLIDGGYLELLTTKLGGNSDDKSRALEVLNG